MDVGDDSTSGNGGLDQGVQLLVSSDGQLQMAGGDPLHLEVLGGVTGQLEDLGSEVLQDGGAVHGGGGTNTASGETPALEVTVDPGEKGKGQNTYERQILKYIFALLLQMLNQKDHII